MRPRVAVAGVLATLLLATGLWMWPRGSTARAAAPVSTTTTSTTLAPTTTSTTQPAPPFEAADAAVGEVALYDSPDAAAPSGSLSNPTSEHVPLVFSVKAQGPPGWLQVQIPRRPNESTAWVHSSDVTVRGLDNRIVVEREARRLTVYKGTTDEVLFQTTVAVGAPATPTPLGDFYIDVVVELTHPSGVYGPFQLSVAGFSDVLQTFGGGPGQIAIHGTNHPELIGEFVSNGCVRLNNDDITALEPLVPAGTPVQIVA